MRTAPIALAFLHDPHAIAQAARGISDLTHFDPDAGDACVLWSLAIRHAVLTGQFDVRLGLEWLPIERRRRWQELITEAEALMPREFDRNGWVVEALQAAWSAIVHTPIPASDPTRGTHPAQHLQLALETAVRGGGDTDTVAAIAGSLLGARWGASAIPIKWQRVLHGWPGMRYRGLVDLALAVYSQGSGPSPANHDHLRALSRATAHPRDPQVLLGPVNAAYSLSPEVDAVVSLCRIEDVHIPVGVSAAKDQIEIWLIDSADPTANPHLEFVLEQAVEAVVQLRSEGRTVFLHCAAGQSRTPTVAALVGSKIAGISPSQALREVVAVLPDARPNALFAQTVANWPTC